MKCIIIFALIAGNLFSDLSDHLKPALNKSSTTQMRNVDFIYMINLDERPEKWDRSVHQLVKYGIVPYRFSAVNGWNLDVRALNDVGLVYSPEMKQNILGTCYPTFEPSHETIQEYGNNYFCHCMSRGAIGIALSHISVLQDAYDSGYETIWVLEDDIEVLDDPRTLSDVIDRLDQAVGKNQWDILFTDRDIRDRYGKYVPNYAAGIRPDYTSDNLFSFRTSVNSEFMKMGARSGAHSMIIRRSGIKKLLQFLLAHQIFFPYDMEYILPHGIRLYSLTHDIVSNYPLAPSDNGGPNYLNKERL